MRKGDRGVFSAMLLLSVVLAVAAGGNVYR